MLYPYRLARFKGLTPNEKLIWAYIQSFGVFYATDKHVADLLGLSTSTVRHALVKFRRICGTKGRNFPRSDVPIHAHNVPKQAQDVPIHAKQDPVLPMKTENRLNNLLNNELKNKLNNGNVPNHAQAGPSEAPTASPLEYDPEDVPFESDPNIVRRVKTPEEEFEEMEALERLKERDRLRRLTRIA